MLEVAGNLISNFLRDLFALLFLVLLLLLLLGHVDEHNVKVRQKVRHERILGRPALKLNKN